MDDNKKMGDLQALRAFLARWIPDYISDARRVETTAVRPIWVREFWRQLGAHATVTSRLYPPDEDRSELVKQLKHEARETPRDLLPRRARLLFWDRSSFFFTDESTNDPDPSVLRFNATMEEPVKVASSFLLFATGVAVRAALPIDPKKSVATAPQGTAALFPNLHPCIIGSEQTIYVPVDDNEEQSEPRLLVVAAR